MKKYIYLPLFFLLPFLFFSCNKEKTLSLSGEWEEMVSNHYSDTIPHSTYHLVLDCGSFRLAIKTFHSPRPGVIGFEDKSYTEYILGAYQKSDNMLYFNGHFCDSNYRNILDSTSTPYSYGSYTDTCQFKIDDKQLMFNLNYSKRNDIVFFRQTRSIDCPGHL